MSLKNALNSYITLAAIFIIISSILFVLFSSSGCAEDEIVNHTNGRIVTGKIYGAQGQPLSGINVSINYGPAAVTTVNGTFRLSVVEPAYDLNIFQGTNNGFFYQYRGLTTLTPVIDMQTITVGSYLNHAAVELKFPRVPAGQSVLYSFLSGANSEVSVSGRTDTSAHLFIRWEGLPNVSGELAFLQVVKDTWENIISHEKFSKKMLSVQDGFTYNEVFTASDLQFNPVEKIVQIMIPPAYTNPNLNVKLLFKSYPWSSAIELLRYGNFQVQNIVVPADLVYPVKITYKLAPGDTINDYRINAYGFMEPGESYTLPILPAISLMYPSGDTTGVNYNTAFSHNLTGNVYEFIIGNYVVYTTSSIAKIPVGIIYGIVLPSNQQMGWSVAVHNISSMDELVKMREAEYPTGHRVRVETPIRLFRTAISN